MINHTTKPNKMWTIEEIRSEVEMAVEKVVTVGDSENIDHNAGLMDVGLDPLGTTELSELLQSLGEWGWQSFICVRSIHSGHELSLPGRCEQPRQALGAHSHWRTNLITHSI